MRKEVYARKPKKVFKTLKEMYGQKMAGVKAKKATKPSGPVSYQKHTYKPFDQTRFYRTIKIILLILVGGLIIATMI